MSVVVAMKFFENIIIQILARVIIIHTEQIIY